MGGAAGSVCQVVEKSKAFPCTVHQSQWFSTPPAVPEERRQRACPSSRQGGATESDLSAVGKEQQQYGVFGGQRRLSFGAPPQLLARFFQTRASGKAEKGSGLAIQH